VTPRATTRQALAELLVVTIANRAQARHMLSRVVADRLGLDPARLPLAVRADGKPVLDPAAGLPDVRFSLSHSGRRALIAIADGVELGADIEQVTEKRSQEYLRDWTRREAYLKGTGRGLRGGPRGLSFEPGAGGLAVIDHGRTVDRWRVVDLDVGAGYVAAIAADSDLDVRLRFDPALVQRP